MAESTVGERVHDIASPPEVEQRHAYVVIGISHEASVAKAVKDSKDGTVRVTVHAHSYKVCDCCMTPIVKCVPECEVYEYGEKVSDD